MAPRGALTYTVGGFTMLASPVAGRTTDARGGPYPEDFNILGVTGDRTFLVHFKIRTFVIETASDGHNARPVLLAHRWARRVTSGEDHLSQIETIGEAVFDVSELLRRGTIPDQYRAELFHAQPSTAFQRVSVEVAPSSDYSTLNYRIVDQERMFSTNPRYGACRVEAHQRNWVTAGSPLMNITTMIPQTLNTGLALGRAALGGRNTGGPAIQATFGFIGGILGQAIDLLPTVNFMLSCKAWSDYPGRKFNLQRLCLGIATTRIGTNGFLSGASTFSLEHDLAGKAVYVDLQHALKYLDGVTEVPFGIGVNGNDPRAWYQIIANSFTDMVFDENISDFLKQDSAFPNYAFPRSGGTRGAAVLMMAQGLGSPGVLPAAPGTLVPGVLDANL